MPAAFHTFPCLSDNIGVLIHDPATGATASVDVPEAEAVERALRETGWSLTHIIVTHRHADHVQGIPALKQKTGARLVAPKKAAKHVPGADELVAEGDQVKVGGLSASVLDTPGHCADHISYWFQADNALFAGDTIFTLGCGRVSEATPAVLWASLQRIAALPDQTLIWSGHEYTLSNAKFALSVDGGNAPVYQWLVNGLPAGEDSAGLTLVPAADLVVRCVMTSDAVCVQNPVVSSNTLTLPAVPVPVQSVGIDASATTICSDSLVLFDADPVNGGTSPAFQWMVNGVDVAQGATYRTAGLSDGDVVVAVDGEAASSPAVLNAIIGRHRVGDVVRLEVRQKGVVQSAVSIGLRGLPNYRLEAFESVGLPITYPIRAFRGRWLSSQIAQ